MPNRKAGGHTWSSKIYCMKEERGAHIQNYLTYLTLLTLKSTLTLAPQRGDLSAFYCRQKGAGKWKASRPALFCGSFFRRSGYTDPHRDAGVMHSVRSVEAAVHWCQESTSLEGTQVWEGKTKASHFQKSSELCPSPLEREFLTYH